MLKQTINSLSEDSTLDIPDELSIDKSASVVPVP